MTSRLLSVYQLVLQFKTLTLSQLAQQLEQPSSGLEASRSNHQSLSSNVVMGSEELETSVCQLAAEEIKFQD